MLIILSLFGPSIVVILMRNFDRLKGWKTNTMGTLTAMLGVLENMDNSFLPNDIASTMITGFGVATILASQFTQRIPKENGKQQPTDLEDTIKDQNEEMLRNQGEGNDND